MMKAYDMTDLISLEDQNKYYKTDAIKKRHLNVDSWPHDDIDYCIREYLYEKTGFTVISYECEETKTLFKLKNITWKLERRK